MTPEHEAAWRTAIRRLDALVVEPYGTDDLARWLARSRHATCYWPRTSFTSLLLSPHADPVLALRSRFVAMDLLPGERCVRVRYQRQIGEGVGSEDWPAANCVTAMERVARWLATRA